MDTILQQWAELREASPILRQFLMNGLAAILIILLGYIIARWIRKKVRGAQFGASRVDNTLRPIIASLTFYVIIGVTVYAALQRLGIEPTVLLAVFGAAGLAIGLALKDTLGNIAAGFMLIILRPLNVGEYIETPHGNGTVNEVGFFNTHIKNIEGVTIFIPNGQIWNNRIQNFGRHSVRKLIVNIGVAYDTDLEAAEAILIDAMRSVPFGLTSPEEPHVFVMEFADSAIILSSRMWLPGANWLPNSSVVRRTLKSALDANNIEIPFPQRVVTTKSS